HSGVSLLLPTNTVVIAGRPLRTLAVARRRAEDARAWLKKDLARKRAAYEQNPGRQGWRRFRVAGELIVLPPPWQRGPRRLFFGGVYLTLEDTKYHFLFIGSTRSGKSMSIRLLMQGTLPSIGQGFGDRAVILDAKLDILGVLAGMNLSCP